MIAEKRKHFFSFLHAEGWQMQQAYLFCRLKLFRASAAEAAWRSP